MKMEICKHPLKCDFVGCDNLAKYSFSTKGLFRRELVFCEKCMLEMFECFSKVVVPKPIQAPFKKVKKERV